jgi:hypothetical protein
MKLKASDIKQHITWGFRREHIKDVISPPCLCTTSRKLIRGTF